MVFEGFVVGQHVVSQQAQLQLAVTVTVVPVDRENKFDWLNQVGGDLQENLALPQRFPHQPDFVILQIPQPTVDEFRRTEGGPEAEIVLFSKENRQAALGCVAGDTGAINAAAHTCYRGLPLPLVFVCEDNGIGISVKTPRGWIAANYGSKPGLRYVYGDARDIVDATRAAREAESCARGARKPVFLHVRTVRLMGHAGSDIESGYRDRAEIELDEAQDPLLHSARRLIEAGVMSRDEIETLYADITGRVYRAMEMATTRPKLTTASQVTKALTPRHRPRRSVRPGPIVAGAPDDARARREPQHMSRLISLTLAEQMERDASVVVFGEDVAKKGDRKSVV